MGAGFGSFLPQPTTPTTTPTPGLQSNLGQPTTQGGGMFTPPQPVAQPAAGGGGSNWFGSITNPLGLGSFVSSAAHGIAQFGAGIIANAAEGVGSLATGQWGQAGHDFGNAGEYLGDFGYGIVTSGENLESTLIRMANLGDPILSNAFSRDIVQPFNKWVGSAPVISGALTPEMRTQLYNQGKGMPATDILTAARTQGIGAAVAETVGQVAAVAGAASLVAGAVGGLAGAIDGTATDAAIGAAEEQSGSLASKIVAAANKTQDIVQPFAHPWQTMGGKAADMFTAMYREANPAEAILPTDVPNPEHQIPQEAVDQVHEQMAPDAAMVDNVVHAKTGYPVGDALAQALDAATGGLTEHPYVEPPVPQGMTRFYRVGQTGVDFTKGAPNPQRATGAAVEDLGIVSHVDVPKDVAATLKAGPNGEYELPAEYATKAIQHDNTFTREVTQPLPKSEPTLEPGNYVIKPTAKTAENPQDMRAGPFTPEARQAERDALHQQTADARESHAPDIAVLHRLAQRLQEPPPQWATDLAHRLPMSVNRTLGKMGYNVLTWHRVHNMQRALDRSLETGQQVARSNPAVQEAEAGARLLLSNTVGRDVATNAIGEELHARLNLTSFLSEFKLVTDRNPSEAETVALADAARGDYKGVTDSMWQSLSAEDRVKLENHLENATAQYRLIAADAQKTLLASRFGARGLETALLHPDEPTMSPEQVRLFKRAIRDMRFEAKAKERIPAELEKLHADVARADAMAERQHQLADDIRNQIGTNLQTINDLFRGLPKGLENEGRDAIAGINSDLSTDGGSLRDIGTNQADHAVDGIYVEVMPQFDVRADAWPQVMQQVLHDALFQPKGFNGRVYDPQALWGHVDSRLSVRIGQGLDGEQHVYGAIAMHTINGDPMQPWQAAIIGAAHEQPTGFDFATGRNVEFSTVPEEQMVAKYYVSDVLNKDSALTKWAGNRRDLATNPGTDITPEMVNREMWMNLWLDHVMFMTNPMWKQGDIFKTTMTLGKDLPKMAALTQTVMEDLTGHPEGEVIAHVNRALSTMDAGRVSRALKWYYDSHDSIERMYRGKTIPLTGRDAAETFYDLLALTSVMASPTQNLGRALMGLANLDEFLRVRQAAFDDTAAKVNDLLAEAERKPNDVVYVVDLGKDTEHTVPKVPKGQTQEGTPISRRWFETPDMRALAGPGGEAAGNAAMTTGPKYRIIDALLGRFNLETANAEDIAAQPEWWTGSPDSLSDKNLANESIQHHAALLGVDNTPEGQAFTQWALQHEDLKSAVQARIDAGKNYVEPVSATDAQRSMDTTSHFGPSREISAAEAQQMGEQGRRLYDMRMAHATDTVDLTSEDFIKQMYAATHTSAYGGEADGLYGGGTLDTHTGKFIPVGKDQADENLWAVTSKPRTTAAKNTINVDPSLPYAKFKQQWLKAVKQWGPQLRMNEAGLGIFHDEINGKRVIEIDPTLITHSVADTEAIGQYTHATGGAFHFKSFDGYWVPHVRDDHIWSSVDKAKAARTASTAAGKDLAKAGPMRQAYENALTEYHGSNALAKLRSFRDNLAHPGSSLAVTLDSIMAQLFGFEKTHWGQTGEYAKYADMIREAAQHFTQANIHGDGSVVMPHEIQALLWVYAKEFIGRQDWGRLLAHQDTAHGMLDTYRNAQERTGILPKEALAFDPLKDWHEENLAFSRYHLGVRQERQALRMKRTAANKPDGVPMSPEDAARLDYLEKVPDRQVSDTMVKNTDTGDIEPAIRHETYYDAKVLGTLNQQHADYIKKVVQPMHLAIAAGDWTKAKSILDKYVLQQHKSIMGGTEGAAFGPGMLEKASSSGRQAIDRLVEEGVQHYIPSPNVDGLGLNELGDRFRGVVRGATLMTPNKMGYIMQRLYHTADFTTLLHEDAHAFRLLAPGDQIAELGRIYPHLQDEPGPGGVISSAKRFDEERFVNDFMAYLRQRSQGGTYVGPLATLFNNVGDYMDKTYGSSLASEAGRGATADSIVRYWDNIFNKEITNPDHMDDPLSAQYVKPTQGVNPQRQRWETMPAFTQRVRQYGEARGQNAVLAQRLADREALARKADTFANNMRARLMQPTRSQARAMAFASRSQTTLAKLNDQLKNVEGNQVPRAWRPFMRAIDSITEQAKTDPTLAAILPEIQLNFAKVLDIAEERGFDATYLPEITWDQAQRYLYGHLTVGDAAMAGARHENTGALDRQGMVTHNLESLGFAQVAALRELFASTKAQFIEANYAHDLPAGAAIPRGWSAWDGARDAILTGKRVEDGMRVAVGPTKIVPDQVFDTLRAMDRPPVDWPFRSVWKPLTSVWKNVILLYSPTWYVKHLIGAISNALLEGVKPRDFIKAWQDFKTGQLPDIVRGRDVMSLLRDGETTSTSMKRGIFTGLGPHQFESDLVKSEGYRSALREFNHRLQGVVKTVDGFGRTAVFEKTLRTTGDATLAAERGIEALGDFNRLGPIERSLVTQIIPFYSFQKAMFRILLRLPVDHPIAAQLLSQLGQIHNAYVRDKLGGALPDLYAGSDFVGGHLMELDKLNPLADSYRIMTPEGIASSMSPFLGLIAQEALNAPGFNSQAGMGNYGQLVQKPDVFHSLLDSFAGRTPGLGQSILTDPLAVTSGLSDQQLGKLQTRIQRTQAAERTVAAGGYVAQEAIKPKATTAATGGSQQGSFLTGGKTTRAAGSRSGARTVRRSGTTRGVRSERFRTRSFKVGRVRSTTGRTRLPRVRLKGAKLASYRIRQPRVVHERTSSGRVRIRVPRSGGARFQPAKEDSTVRQSFSLPRATGPTKMPHVGTLRAPRERKPKRLTSSFGGRSRGF